MSGHQLQTWTERTRDQQRIDMLEAELKAVEDALRVQVTETLRWTAAYQDSQLMLEHAKEWRAHAALYAIASGMVAVALLRLFV